MDGPKGKYQSMDNKINRKIKGKLLPKSESHTQTQGNLIYFDNH